MAGTISAGADLLAVLEPLAIKAGAEILAVRDRGVVATEKADKSPVTEADERAEAIILEGLRAAFPGVAIVAEEEAAAGRVPDVGAEPFFLVDPLDGTKEFIGGKPDFTVNIALVRNGLPLAGVVYAPARGVLYSGGSEGASRAEVQADGQVASRVAIKGGPAQQAVRVVASKSHNTPETDEFIGRYPGAERVSVGSSLKFCLVADGSADLYPRFGRTMEWDTAAGDAVLRAAGGKTVTLQGEALAYGKRNQSDDADFANPHFICVSGQCGALI